jgi:hypothetical protein
LESVDVSGNKRITGVGLRHLAGLPQLKYLQLANCNIDDNGVGYLKDLPALSSVELDRNPITDEGLKKLVDMPTLGSINLGGCKAITQPAIDAWLATRTRNITIKPDGHSLRYSPRRKPRPTTKTPAIGGAGM